MRVAYLLSLLVLLGCAVETDALPGPDSDTYRCPTRASIQNYVSDDAGSGDVGSSDIGSDTGKANALEQVADAGPVPHIALDAGAIPQDTQGAETQTNCVQRAIVNGYAGCPAGDPLRFTCDDNPAFAVQCKTTIDCLARHPLCDRACFVACAQGSDVEFYVYRVVTPFCGVQLWHPDVAWGCLKAL